MANGTASQIQLPAGYEDATPVAGPLATQNASGISLPPGYEDAKPVAGPLAQTPPVVKPLSWGGVASELGNQALDVGKGIVKSLVPGSPENAAAVEGAASGIWHSTFPGQLVDSVKQTLPLIDTYEKSRAAGASITDSLKSVNETAKEQLGKHDVLGQAVEAYRTNPNHETAKLLLDGTLAATALYGLGGAAPEAEAGLTAPAAEAAGDQSLFQRVMNPFRRAFSPTAATQPEAQAALREGAVTAAKDAGVATPVVNAPGAGIRTLMTKPIAEAAKLEDGLYASVNKAAETDMKSLYDRQEELQDAIDDPTNLHQKPALQAELKTTQSQIATGEANVQSKLGTDAPNLISRAKAATQQRYAMEAGDAKLFNNESVVKGNLAHGSNETVNVDAAIRQAELLDKPSKFAPRDTPTRLQQIFGDDGAQAFKQKLYAAQKAGQTVLTRNQVLGVLAGTATAGGTAWEFLTK